MPGLRRKIPWRPAAVACLASGGTIPEAAAAAKVSPRTVSRWLAIPRFAANVTKAREEMMAQALGSAASVALGAVSVLKSIMDDPEAPAAARVSAARVALDHLIRGREHATLAERLDALEAALQVGRPGTSLLTTAREVPR